MHGTKHATRSDMKKSFRFWLILFMGFLTACTRPAPDVKPWNLPTGTVKPPVLAELPTRTPFIPSTRVPGAPVLSPTPDPPRVLPTMRAEPQQYVVQTGDSLGQIAQKYGISIDDIVRENKLTDPDRIDVGQTLTIPVATPKSKGSSFKIIPDSELVNGPTSADFDIQAFVLSKNGYLYQYTGEIDGQNFNGAEIVKRVSIDYSVNPRLLLALLEFQSGWVTNSNPGESTRDYPIGLLDTTRKGLYKQLSWAADKLNRGYYLWRVNAISNWVMTDGNVVPLSPTMNAGTAGVQNLFSTLLDLSRWEKAVSPQGIFATYQALFGYPFDYSIDPILPSDLQQPLMQLPIESGTDWFFTGGPHGGWGDGSAWAALDFAPPGEQTGCYISSAWAIAAADGLVVRAENGSVILDLDGDGIEQTGWTLLYLHVSSQDRVKVGTLLKAGDHIGHPSCEGGVSAATHLHLARRYNGEWIPADGLLPFNLDGWISKGSGSSYDGFLTRNGKTIEAYDGRSPENQIQR
jgi:LasA protease